MKRRRMPDMREGGVNVTPLIDIVMCMIVFFMLVAKIGVDTGGEKDIEIPASVYGTQLSDMGNTLTLNVRRGPAEAPLVSALLNGVREELTLSSAGRESQLLRTLEFYRYGGDYRPGGGDDNANFRVNLRAQKDLEYSYIQPVLITCAQAGVNVNFTTVIETIEVER